MLHDASQSGGAAGGQSCANAGCHTTKDARPADIAADSCGTGSAGGCHSEKTTVNHGGKHLLNAAASAYNNSTMTGCTNSGTGCHGPSLGTSIATYHPNSGCVDGPCHTSADKPTHHQTFVCGDCHDSTYAGAPDTTALADIAPSGHYSETTHTATGLSATVSAGGTYTATCVTCHNPVSATLPDGLYTQHQGLGSGLGSTTCADCHNKNAAVSAIVSDATRTNTCAACHTAGVLPTMVAHGTSAPVAAGTEADGAGSCATAGCHATTDLHALHANNALGAANGCTMAGCHDATKQGVKPTAKGCGAAGDCHTGAVHPAEATKHTTLASSACTVCHAVGDLKAVHGGAASCATCHGNPTYPTLPTGKLECTSCHNGVAVGTHPYTPDRPEPLRRDHAHRERPERHGQRRRHVLRHLRDLPPGCAVGPAPERRGER